MAGLVSAAIDIMARQAKSSGRKFRLKKPPRMALPIGIERDYMSELRSVIEADAKVIRTILIPQLPSLVSENKAFRPDSIDARSDDASRRLNDLMEATRVTAEQITTPNSIENTIKRTSFDVSNFNKIQLGRTFSTVISIDLFGGEPWLAQELSNFAAENVSLIQNVRQNFRDQTQEVVFRGLRQGKRHEVIAQEILGISKTELNRVSRFRLAKTRANLIARDQISKLNGQLNRLRQQDVGIKKYIWRTVGDGRVRPDHAARSGIVFKWSQPPFDGHPGEPINCRCNAEPVFTDL